MKRDPEGGPIRLPGMLLIAGASRDAGKTTFAGEVVRRFADPAGLVAVKVTTIHQEGEHCPRGRHGCGVCAALRRDYELIEERLGDAPDKDTGRLLAAGARRALWMKTRRASLAQAAAALAGAIGPQVSVCESNSLRLVARPDLFLMVGWKDGPVKPSAAAVRPWVDRFIEPPAFLRTLFELELREGGWHLREPATLIVLAGGRSARMGTDKCFLPIDGSPLIERLIRTLAPRFEQVVISANEQERFGFLGHAVVPDGMHGAGPLAGVTAALRAARNDLAMVVPCDLPDPDVGLVERLLRAAEAADGAVPTAAGRPEPLFAAYRRSLIPWAEEALRQGELRIRALYPRCNIRNIEMGAGWRLLNLNTPGDYRDYLGGRIAPGPVGSFLAKGLDLGYPGASCSEGAPVCAPC